MKQLLLWIISTPLICSAQTFPSVTSPTITSHSSYGTCAVAVHNAGNAAFVIDSALTVTTNGVRSNLPRTTCKLWLNQPNMIVATTGLLTTGPMFGRNWDANRSARKYLSPLSLDPSDTEVDEALKAWGTDLIAYLKANPSASSQVDGEEGNLVLVYRSLGKLHMDKERITSHDKKPFRDLEASYRWQVPDSGAGIMYSGYCRSFIQVPGAAPPQSTPKEREFLNKLGLYAKSTSITSAEQLGSVAMEMEQELASISREHDSESRGADFVGPPYQLATLSAETGVWKKTFSPPCEDVNAVK